MKIIDSMFWIYVRFSNIVLKKDFDDSKFSAALSTALVITFFLHSILVVINLVFENKFSRILLTNSTESTVYLLVITISIALILILRYMTASKFTNENYMLINFNKSNLFYIFFSIGLILISFLLFFLSYRYCKFGIDHIWHN